MPSAKNEIPVVITEEDVVYACKVLDAIGEAFDKIASQPTLLPQLAFEIAQQTPEVLDALLTLTREDCRIVVYDLAKKVLNAVNVCLPTQKKTQP